MNRRGFFTALCAPIAAVAALRPGFTSLPPFFDPTAMNGRYFGMQNFPTPTYDPAKFDAFLSEHAEAVRRWGMRSTLYPNYLDGGS
jgi:hypothetical protein